MRGGALDASVTLEEVLTVVASKRVPLAPELAGYLVLELAEHADPAGGDVDPASVFVGDEGAVALVRSRRDRVIGDAESSIRAALGRLLDAGGSQTPALSAASKRRSGAGLHALAAELEGALIPVNRAAARRALARLAREVKRITSGAARNVASAPPAANIREPLSFVAERPLRGPVLRGFSPEDDSTTPRSRIPKELLKVDVTSPWDEEPAVRLDANVPPPLPSEADVDALIAQFRVSGGSDQQHSHELKAIAELEPTPAPPPAAARVARSDAPSLAERTHLPRESDIDALLAIHSDATAAGTPAPPSLARPVTPPRAREVPSTPPPPRGPKPPERKLATQPSHLKKTRATLPSVSDVRSGRGSGWLVVLAIAATGGGSYVVWKLRGDVLGRHAPAALPSAQAAPVEAPPPCLGTLVVTDVPSRAEVLLREGQAPVDIPRMPVGARLEFVATAEGYAPKRVVVPGGVPWDPGPDGKPRFEAAVQHDPSRSHAGANDPWPVGEPGSAVGGEGSPGTVRVVASPRGAEVWMLAGIAPDARIERLRCDQDIDVLLAGPSTYRNRLRVRAGDFVPDDSPSPSAGRSASKARIARVSAK